MKPESSNNSLSRRSFLGASAVAGLAAGIPASFTAEPVIPGFERSPVDPEVSKGWQPFSDRKLRVGIAGYGLCKFGADFSFQDHPNVDIVAVSDLIPERCTGLAKACRCSKTYPSLEEMVKDDRIEAVFLTTDAAGHAQHAITALQHGKHVACAVPAVLGSLEDADNLFQAVKRSGKQYMMFETSCFHPELYAMRRIYEAGGFGKLSYVEGEYFHYAPQPLPSYKEWRVGLPPQWYCTHSTAYYVGVTDGVFTEVSCMGMPSKVEHCRPENNRYKNPFATEIALFRSADGVSARMIVSKDTPGPAAVEGRIRGERGSYYDAYSGLEKKLPSTRRPPLPPGVAPGGHKGSHGYLTNEFVSAIIQNRKPLIDIAASLNMTVPGIVAHQSALKGGELLRISHYRT